MKKLLMIVVAIAAAGTAQAYDLHFHNKSANNINVKVNFGGPGVCGRNSVLLKPGAKKTLGTGACCLNWGEAIVADGPFNGKKSMFEGTNTGFGLSCRSNKFTIRVVEGNVIVER